MSAADWIVLALTLLLITAYGFWRGRGSRSVSEFLLADRSLGWLTVALSIMATQASAITFTSTPGQAYVDGMRFLQFYFGLPLAMVILSVTAVPRFHRLGVYSAYEYLEHRFDARMRVTGAILFLLSRGLAAGMTIYAPSLVLSVMLGLDVRITSGIIGGIIILVASSGGVKAINHTHVVQMFVIMGGMIASAWMVVRLLPADVSMGDALTVAGAAGRLNTIDFSFDLTNRYNLWSGLIGGMFVALAYFGTDQSQVQRYLTGRSVTQSRLALLFNGVAKIPMQFFMLLLGVLVYVFFVFTPPPVTFDHGASTAALHGPVAAAYRGLETQHGAATESRRKAAYDLLHLSDTAAHKDRAAARERFRAKQDSVTAIRSATASFIRGNVPGSDGNDTNYIFLHFVLAYLPAGLVGLVFACIFTASLSSSSGELSALATISIIDIYRRHVRTGMSEKHYLTASRMFMAAWGVYGIAFAQYASSLGSLIEAVNILGSLFYGTMLGIFLLAFYVSGVDGRGTFWGAVVGEGAVIACALWTDIAWLWYNVIGCAVVVGVAFIVTWIDRPHSPAPAD
jgi:Na+/proline symporter